MRHKLLIPCRGYEMFLNYAINKSKEILKRLNITEKEEIIRILSRKGQLKILKRD